MPKIRVLVVDDAVVIRKMLTEMLSQDVDIEVAGIAANGKIALAKIPQVNPDLITLDVEMPEMDGIETIKEIRKKYPKMPVIMFSTLTQRGAGATIEALSYGATDYVSKPANVGSVMDGFNRIKAELILKIKQYCSALLATPASASVGTSLSSVSVPEPHLGQMTKLVDKTFDILAVGTSTGGPNALIDVFSNITKPLGVPIVIVQHMPPVFTEMLAKRLDEKCPSITFHEAQEDMEILPDHAYIAPGGKHLDVVRKGTSLRAHLHEGPPENSCRPAVDVLFRSVVSVFGARVLGVILTGMGKDGLRGCEAIKEQKGSVIAQDKDTSVVWGMPGYVVQENLADLVLPLDQVANTISKIYSNRVHNKTLVAH